MLNVYLKKKISKISPSCCLPPGGGKSTECKLHVLGCLLHSLMLGSAMWLDLTNGMWASGVCNIAEALNSALLWGLLSCNDPKNTPQLAGWGITQWNAVTSSLSPDEAIMRDMRAQLRGASQPTADQMHEQASPRWAGWPADSGALISSYFKLLRFGVFCSRALLW